MADSRAVDPKDAPAPAESVVLAAIEHLLDPELTERRRAHDARLNGHVERRVCERVPHRARGRGEGRVREDLVDRLKLGVTRRLGVGREVGVSEISRG